MKRTIAVSACAAMLGLAAVTAIAGSARPDSGVTPGSDRYQCFDPDFVRSFQTIENHKVIIVSDRNQAYELTLGGVCIGLDTSFQIGIRSRHGGGDVCGPLDADIVWNDNLRGLQSCRVTTMRHLQGEEAAPYVRAGRSDERPEGGN